MLWRWGGHVSETSHGRGASHGARAGLWSANESNSQVWGDGIKLEGAFSISHLELLIQPSYLRFTQTTIDSPKQIITRPPKNKLTQANINSPHIPFIFSGEYLGLEFTPSSLGRIKKTLGEFRKFDLGESWAGVSWGVPVLSLPIRSHSGLRLYYEFINEFWWMSLQIKIKHNRHRKNIGINIDTSIDCAYDTGWHHLW